MTVRQRIVAGTAATLTWQAVDQNGEPSDPGTTTVAVTGSDGTVILAAGTATTPAGTTRTVAIPAQEIDELTVIWSGASATETVHVDVVGGVYFTVANLRANERSLNSTIDYEAADVIAKRIETETLFEQRTFQAFVPRLAILTTTRQAQARRTMIREVRWAQTTDGDFITDTDAIARVVEVETWGVRCAAHIDRVAVVHGYDAPPADVLSKAMQYTRHLLTTNTAGLDLRVLAQSSPDGIVTRFATPGAGRWITGIPDIDEVLFVYRDPVVPRSVRQGGY